MTTATSHRPTRPVQRLSTHSILAFALALMATLIVSPPASAASQNFWAEGCLFNVQAIEHWGNPRASITDNNGLCGQLKLRMQWSGGEFATDWKNTNQIILDATGDQCRARGAVIAPSGQAYVSDWVVHDINNC